MKRLILSFIFAIVLANPVSSPGNRAAAGDLTLPFESQAHYAVNAWLDHTSPVVGDTNPTVTRYDGATGVPYNGHRGIDFAVPSGPRSLPLPTG